MARVLFTVWPFAGHLYPDVAIAQALRQRGHTCVFYTGPSARKTLADEGFDCHPFVQVDEERARRTMRSKASGGSLTRELWSMRRRLHQWLVDTIPQQLADLRQIIPRTKPDILVTDPTMWAPILVLHETMGLPVTVASFMPGCLIPGPDAPPFGLGLPPPRKRTTRTLSRLVSGANDLFASSVRTAVNELRRTYGLAPIAGSVMQFMARMPLTLVPGVPEFDYDRQDLPPSVHYVGSCLWNRPRSADTKGWLDRIPRERPWVHVTEGTFHGGAPFLLRTAVEALADLPVEVIITTTDRDPRDLIPESRSNLHVTRWVSHSELFLRTAVVVTTGGAGTVMAALGAGCPLVVVPTEFDKPDNARRVEVAGVGVNLPPRRCTPRRLRDAVRRVLDDPAFRENAERLSAALARGGGAGRAAELIERLAVRSNAATPARVEVAT